MPEKHSNISAWRGSGPLDGGEKKEAEGPYKTIEGKGGLGGRTVLNLRRGLLQCTMAKGVYCWGKGDKRIGKKKVTTACSKK